ncbi:MAG: peptidoglycan DD-metalloendopeptidase family protein [Eubacterium sp.]
MKKITKYHKRIRLTYIVTALSVCLLMMLSYSFSGFAMGEEKYNGYYIVSLNGQELGATDDPAQVEEIVKEARERIMTESTDMVFIDTELEVTEQNHDADYISTEDDFENQVYEVLLNSKLSVNDTVQAYVLNVDGHTVNLSSLNDVKNVLTKVKNNYDKKDGFEINLVESESSHFNTWTVELSKNKDTKSSLESVSFQENVEIIEAFVNAQKILSVDEAVEDLTEKKPEKDIYIVEEGDCLSLIADNYDLSMAELLELNDYLDEDSIILIDDEIVVTVPTPALSVVTSKQTTYKEKYSAEIEYIQSDELYEGDEEVITKGTRGIREVTAFVTSVNGVRTNTEILEENIIKEATPTVIAKGTREIPTYIKPVTGGRLSSTFGYRQSLGDYHKGVDWAVPVGTAVKASCSGTVVLSGWSSSYGYTILIQHSDGNQTRYAHLSQLLVSSGQYVTQGDKIALSGNTGQSTGPHLHFEIIVNGIKVDPLGYVPAY